MAFLLIDYKGGEWPTSSRICLTCLGPSPTWMVPSLCGHWPLSMRRSIVGSGSLANMGSTISTNIKRNLNWVKRLNRFLPLFLISDEFAELKVNQPDFIKELVSIARVGRSLRVHLILATQKPSGVVDDQIWSNSRFKLALRWLTVATLWRCCGRQMRLRSPQTGRAYLQVGNNRKSMNSSKPLGLEQTTSLRRTS